VKPTPADVASIGVAEAPRTTAFADYLALTKPRLNFLVVATSAAGYYLGISGAIDAVSMVEAVAGTALVAGGAAVLNQLYERDTDALMRRTRLRPLPSGRVAPADARMFGLALSAAGLALLAARANWLSTALALATLLTYLAIYTPMKRRTPLSTIVGAVPGAAGADRLDRVARQHRPRRGGAVRDRVLLAAAALHGDLLALPRRLREGRLPDAAGDRS
jgi:heme O synthase-like polyprenyltransferase